MGGAASTVSNSTQNILLESAFFTPDSIAGKGRRYGISTDSSYRFERGVDFANTRLAMQRASALIIEICGGQASDIAEHSAELPKRAEVSLSLDKLNSILGITLSTELVSQQLSRLGFAFQQQGNQFVVQAPSYRFDISREEDLVEEIARLHGYDNIPAIAPIADLHMLPDAEGVVTRAVLQDVLVANGYQEVVNYSFVDEAWENELLGNPKPIKLKNPIASNMSVMRSGLWGGLLDTLVYNLNRQQDRVRIFEMGASYAEAKEGFQETMRISGLAYGDVMPEQWGEAARNVDFYDVKADVDALTGGLAEYVAAQHPALHPGQTAQIVVRGRSIGWIGKLHPKWQQHYQLPKGAVLFEMDLATLQHRSIAKYSEVAKFPPVRRDIAVLVDEAVSVDVLIKTMKKAKVQFVTDIALFDVYRGKGIAEDKKSLAFYVLMQDTQKSLTDAEVDSVMASLLELIKNQHGAELR
jgi:phenylalanyl-tRNA synthetase beta chain